MLSPRPKTKRRTLRDQANPLVSFFLEATYTLPLYLYIEGAVRRFPLKSSLENKEQLIMKHLSVVVAGSGQIRDVQIQPGTTAGDILHQLNLPDYLLSKGPNEPFFAAAESVYDKVKDGEKIFASTKADVGVLPQCA